MAKPIEKARNSCNNNPEKKKLDKSKEIIEESIKLFNKKGINNVPMKEIAKAVKYSRTTLYLYFENKKDLLLAIGSRGFKYLIDLYNTQIKKQENITGYEKVKCMFDALESMHKNMKEITLVFSYVTSHDIYINDSEYSAEFNRLSEGLRADMIKYIKEGIEDGSIKPETEPVIAALSIHLVLSGLYHQLMVRRDDMDRQGLHVYSNERIRNIINSTILSSLKNK